MVPHQRHKLLSNSKNGKCNNINWNHLKNDQTIKKYADNTKCNVEQTQFPKEKMKALAAFLLAFFSCLLMVTFMAIIHDYVPDRKLYAPLPDVILDAIEVRDWCLALCEYLMIFATSSNLIMMIFHKHRYILIRRFFLLISIICIYRSLTISVTILPIASTTYYCSPQSKNTTVFEIARRVYDMSLGLGLSFNGRQSYCGDYIFSGHTVEFLLGYLFISEYTPKSLFLIHWFYGLLAFFGIVALEISRAHYTIDVVLAYYTTTRLFWVYHTLANNSILKKSSEINPLCRLWWFKIFLWFEGNVNEQVPREWPDWPFSWPTVSNTKNRRIDY